MEQAGTTFRFVVGLVGSVSLWWRRRYPVALAVGLLPLSVCADTPGFAILVALYTVAAACDMRTTGVLVTLHLAATCAYLVMDARPGTLLEQLAVGVTLTVAAVALGRLARSRAALLDSLRARALTSELEVERRLAQGRRAERERIARDMHDVLAHRLSLVNLYANTLAARQDLTREESLQVTARLQESARQSMTDLRAVLGLLRSADGEEAACSARSVRTVPQLVDEARRSGTTVTMEGEPALIPTDGLIGLTAYRVVQEGLTNARKHAPGSPVTIEVRREGEDLRLRVASDLPASGAIAVHPVTPGNHWGLVGLEERVHLLGGSFRSGPSSSSSGARFILEAHLPGRP